LDCSTDAIFDVMVAHVERHVGRIGHVIHPPGPEIVHVDILHVPASKQRRWHTLVTCGMSRRPMCPPKEAADCRLAELFLRLPAEWPVCVPAHDIRSGWPFLQLGHLARFPHLAETWLWEGHTVGAPDPKERIAPGVGFTAWILGPHLSLGHDGCTVRFGRQTIRLFSALPIYPEELELAMMSGSEALFLFLEAAGVSDMIRVRRRNCVTGQVPRK